MKLKTLITFFVLILIFIISVVDLVSASKKNNVSSSKEFFEILKTFEAKPQLLTKKESKHVKKLESLARYPKKNVINKIVENIFRTYSLVHAIFQIMNPLK